MILQIILQLLCRARNRIFSQHNLSFTTFNHGSVKTKENRNRAEWLGWKYFILQSLLTYNATKMKEALNFPKEPMWRTGKVLCSAHFFSEDFIFLCERWDSCTESLQTCRDLYPESSGGAKHNGRKICSHRNKTASIMQYSSLYKAHWIEPMLSIKVISHKAAIKSWN